MTDVEEGKCYEGEFKDDRRQRNPYLNHYFSWRYLESDTNFSIPNMEISSPFIGSNQKI